MNMMKDGYLKAADWIEANPQKTFWYALGSIIVAIFLL